MCNCYRGEHFPDNTQKRWSQHGLRKQRSAQHLWQHTDAFQGACCSPGGSSSNITSTDERALGSAKNKAKPNRCIFPEENISFPEEKFYLSGRTLVLIEAEQKEELVGITGSSWFLSRITSHTDTVPLAQQMLSLTVPL